MHELEVGTISLVLCGSLTKELARMASDSKVYDK